MKKQPTVKSLRDQLKAHTRGIAKHRDALRKLRDDIEDVLVPTNDALQSLEQSIDTLSEQV